LAPIAAYVTGWFNFLGNAAGDASFAASWAQFLASAILAATGEDGPELNNKHICGISIGVLFVWSLLNLARIDQVGWINNIAAVVQFGSVFVIIVCVLVMSDSLQSADFVFTKYYNTTGIEEKSYVGAIGLLGILFSFSGFEASAHMAEETHGARSSAPRGVINTCLATGLCGLGYILALLYATDDIDIIADEENSVTGTAAVEVFIRSCGRAGGAGLAFLVVLNLWFSGVSSVTVTGRITYALARDGAFPYSPFLAKTFPKMRSPANSIMMVFVFDALLLLLQLGDNSSIAFENIVGITVIGFQVSYALPILFRLMFVRGDIKDASLSLGKWSVPLGVISVIWLFGTSTLFFLPVSKPLNKETMNYSCVVIGGVAVLAAIYWIVWGRHVFVGPRRFHHHVVPSARPSSPSGVQMVNVSPSRVDPELSAP